MYEYARNDISVELPVREIEIYDLKLVSDVKDNEFYMKCHVSKGTYIRSLVRDIGISLGTVATMVELERTRLGQFGLENTYTLEDIQYGEFDLISIVDALDLPRVVVDKEVEKKIRNGQVLKKFFGEEMVMILNENEELIAIYQVKDQEHVKPYRMFCN